CLGLPREHLDGAVELARQPASGVLAAGLHEHSKLLRGFVRIRRGCARDDALHLLDLAPSYVFEAGADALHGLHFLTLDPLHELALTTAHALLELLATGPA